MKAIIYSFLRSIGFYQSKKKESKIDPPFFTKDHFSHERYTIGEFTYGKPKVYDWCGSSNLVIGRFCSIADEVVIFLDGNHRTDWTTTYPFSKVKYFFPESSSIQGHPASKGDIVIGNDVWIGYASIILSGVTIADGAVVGAGSVVSKNIGPYEIWAGNPAMFIKKRFSQDTIDELLRDKWWDNPIDTTRSNVSKLCSPPQ